MHLPTWHPAVPVNYSWFEVSSQAGLGSPFGQKSLQLEESLCLGIFPWLVELRREVQHATCVSMLCSYLTTKMLLEA